MSVTEARRTDGRYDEVRLDRSRSLATVDLVHSKTHDGKLWTHTFEFSALGAAASVSVGIAAAVGKRIHCEAIVSADNAGSARVFRRSNFSAGSAVAGANNDFDSDEASPAAIVSGPSIVSDGALFEGVAFASGVGNTGGGSSGSRHEFIVSPTNRAIVRFTARSAGTNGFIMIILYEE